MKLKSSIVALLLFLLLTACTGTASNSQPTTLQVARPSLQQVASLNRTVSNAPAVQQLYTSAQALPHLGQQTLHCPNDFALVYHLTFLADTSPLQQIDVQPLGCRLVHLSQTDVRRADQNFLTLFAKTIGLSSLIPTGLLPTR